MKVRKGNGSRKSVAKDDGENLSDAISERFRPFNLLVNEDK